MWNVEFGIWNDRSLRSGLVMLRAKLEKLMAMAAFMMSLSSRTKAFSRGEGGAAPKQAFIYIVAFCKKINVQLTTSFAVP